MQGLRVSSGFGLAVCCACGAKAPSPTVPNASAAQACPPVSLSIVATNDVHGRLERLPIVAGFVNNLRKAHPGSGVLLLDAGDAFQGTIESNLNEGGAVMAAYRAMGYSAMTLGNHEFDFGPLGPSSSPQSASDDPRGALKQRVAESNFPILAANIVDATGHAPAWPNLLPSTEVTVRGVRVGIVGVLTEGAADVIKRPNFDGLRATPMAPVAEHEALRLRKAGADVVVVLAHEGGECTRFDDPKDLSSCNPKSEIFRFARALPKGLVDVIVGGHKNAGVAHFVEGIPIVHAPSNLVAFSRVDLVFDPATRRVISRHIEPPHPVCTVPMESGCNPGNYEGAPVVADWNTTLAVRPALQDAREVRNEPVGVFVEAPFPVVKHGEMALGNLFADIMREAVPGSDAAIGNAGSVRDVLPQGELTFGELHHVMPFDNQLAKVEVTGAEFARALTASLLDEDHGEPAISGIRVSAECEDGALKVTLKHPDGAAVRPDELLTVATSDFLALGGDGLFTRLHLPEGRVTLNTGTTVRDALIAGLHKRHSIRPTDPALIDSTRPRIELPMPHPVRCAPAQRPANVREHGDSFEMHSERRAK
ncbi:MAG TPA: bifunctional UDP-sugar hydrolase/5'-nucleotidase [Polyangiaceae bacterium]|nr:bifunctional UDP-sugar hydrolase/5'-nucleotidase [Polyangiaceae bacterium]